MFIRDYLNKCNGMIFSARLWLKYFSLFLRSLQKNFLYSIALKPLDIDRGVYEDVTIIGGIRFFLYKEGLYSLLSNKENSFEKIYDKYYMNEENNTYQVIYQSGLIHTEYRKSYKRKIRGNTVQACNPMAQNFGHYMNEALQHLLYAFEQNIQVDNIIVDSRMHLNFRNIVKILAPNSKIISIAPQASYVVEKLIVDPRPNFIVGWLRDGGFKEKYSLGKDYYARLHIFIKTRFESCTRYRLYKILLDAISFPKNLFYIRSSHIRRTVNIDQIIALKVLCSIFPGHSIFVTYYLTNRCERLFCQGGSEMYNYIFACNKEIYIAIDTSDNMSRPHLENDFLSLGHRVSFLKAEVIENKKNDYMINSVQKDLRINIHHLRKLLLI